METGSGVLDVLTDNGHASSHLGLLAQTLHWIRQSFLAFTNLSHWLQSYRNVRLFVIVLNFSQILLRLCLFIG